MESSTDHSESASAPPTAGRSKAERSELSTKLLLRSAADLIGEVGYERATLAAIGKRAGYSHGLVTRRFGSKESLLFALLDQMVVRWAANEMRPAVGARTGLDAMIVIVDSVRSSCKRSPSDMKALYALMFEALRPTPTLSHTVAALHKDLRGEVLNHIERGIARGTVRSEIDPPRAADLFVATLRGCAYQWLLAPNDFDLDGALSAFTETLRILYTPTDQSKVSQIHHGHAPAPRA